MEAHDDAARITPAPFANPGDGNRVYFVETIAGDATTVQNVFVSSVQQAAAA